MNLKIKAQPGYEFESFDSFNSKEIEITLKEIPGSEDNMQFPIQVGATIRISPVLSINVKKQISVRDMMNSIMCEGKKIKVKKETTVRDRINNFEDVLRENGMTVAEFDAKYYNIEPKDIANEIECLIVSAYNELKLPDGTTTKLYPQFIHDSEGFRFHNHLELFSNTCAASRQSFHGEDAMINMLDAVKKFEKEYKNSRHFYR